MATGRDPELLHFVFERLHDGNAFEDFAQHFLAAVNGSDFVPVGGMHDHGIDGLEHVFADPRATRFIYQASIQAEARQKIRDTLKALRVNAIDFSGLYYVTSRVVDDQDRITEAMVTQFGVPVWIRDRKWFAVNLNRDARTVGVFDTFVARYFHEYERPGASFELTDLVGDPRLYVFLRQMFDQRPRDVPLQTVLVDALILFALEDTDPIDGRMMTREQISNRIRDLVNFDLALLERLIDERLDALSTKPRQINFHGRQRAYVLPFATRTDIRNRNIRDKAMLDEFRESIAARLRHFGVTDAEVAEVTGLVERVLHKLFHDQGLEFANFVTYNEGENVLDKHLDDFVSLVFEAEHVPPDLQPRHKAAIVLTLREVVYNGSDIETDVLSYLARTYSMLFLLQIDPQLYTYFAELASKLVVFVDASVLLPAMSEYYLPEKNQRYANLLVRSKQAGVRLFVDDRTVEELATHFVSLHARYEAEFRDTETIYDTDEAIFYVDELMLRAYFYARARGQVARFQEYLDTFVTIALMATTEGKDELKDWLREMYGIEARNPEHLGAHVGRDDLSELTEALTEHRRGPGRQVRAQNDARMILAIHNLRYRNAEASDAGAFGYKTWWLSMDTTTGRVAHEILQGRYHNCYLRPDFLNDFVAFAPQQHAIDQTFEHMFPSLTGVSLTYHVPHDIGAETREFVRQFATRNSARTKATIRQLSDQLKTSGARAGAAEIHTFLDEERARLLRDLPRSFGP